MEKECNHEALTNVEYIYTPTKSLSLPLNNPYVSLARTFRILQVRSYDTQSKKITCLACCWQGICNSKKLIAAGPEHFPKYPPSPPPQNPWKVNNTTGVYVGFFGIDLGFWETDHLPLP